MSSDALIRYEEWNYDNLVEKFIDKHRSEWEVFIMEQYENDSQEPDIDRLEEK